MATCRRPGRPRTRVGVQPLPLLFNVAGSGPLVRAEGKGILVATRDFAVHSPFRGSLGAHGGTRKAENWSAAHREGSIPGKEGQLRRMEPLKTFWRASVIGTVPI